MCITEVFSLLQAFGQRRADKDAHQAKYQTGERHDAIRLRSQNARHDREADKAEDRRTPGMREHPYKVAHGPAYDEGGRHVRRKSATCLTRP